MEDPSAPDDSDDRFGSSSDSDDEPSHSDSDDSRSSDDDSSYPTDASDKDKESPYFSDNDQNNESQYSPSPTSPPNQPQNNQNPSVPPQQGQGQPGSPPGRGPGPGQGPGSPPPQGPRDGSSGDAWVTSSKPSGSIEEKLKDTATAAGIAIFAFFFGVFLVFGALSVLFELGFSQEENAAVFVSVQFIFLQGVAFGGVSVAYLTISDLGLGFLKARFPSLRDIGWAIGGFLLFIVLIIIISNILTYFGVESASNQIEKIGAKNPEIFLVLIPVSFLLIGPGEELLYRGVVQGVLRKSFSATPAIVIASALFAAIHVFALTGSGSKLVYLAVVFILALVLGGIYEKTRNLVVPSLIHGAYNALLFLLMYFRVTSGSTSGLLGF